MSKKLIAILLAVILSVSVVAVPVAAAGVTLPNTSIENMFYMLIDRLVSWLLSYFNKFWPGAEDTWQNQEEYNAEDFFPGEETFSDIPTQTEWELGYAGASLLDGIEPMSGEFFLAGSLEPLKGRVPTTVYDDQRVRVYALSDGNGTVVHAVLDAFGISRGDVNVIRDRLAEFAKENDIISLNVSVLHQHSCIDTLGLSVPLVQALFTNTAINATDALQQAKVQKSQKFMDNLTNKTVAAVMQAVKNMEPGVLTYNTKDVSEYIHDKRAPYFYDGNVHRLMFTPSDGSRATWIVQFAIHTTGLGASADELCADFPYYMEQEIRETAGVNLVCVQGAELAITSTYQEPYASDEALDGYARLVEYGKDLARQVMTMDLAQEEVLAPVLNVKHQEVALHADNEVLMLAAREGVLNAVITKSDKGYNMITEIGYITLGSALLGAKVAIFVCPGEFDPAIVYGNEDAAGNVTMVESGSGSWTGEAWGREPLSKFTGVDQRHVMVYGLCNDQCGYVLRDNEYHSIIDNNEEILSVSTTAGSTFTEAFTALLESVAA